MDPSRTRKIYFAGDTGYTKFFKEIRRATTAAPDLALLPIGAYEPRCLHAGPVHMNPADAVQALLRT